MLMDHCQARGAAACPFCQSISPIRPYSQFRYQSQPFFRGVTIVMG